MTRRISTGMPPTQQRCAIPENQVIRHACGPNATKKCLSLSANHLSLTPRSTAAFIGHSSFVLLPAESFGLAPRADTPMTGLVTLARLFPIVNCPSAGAGKPVLFLACLSKARFLRSEIFGWSPVVIGEGPCPLTYYPASVDTLLNLIWPTGQFLHI